MKLNEKAIRRSQTAATEDGCAAAQPHLLSGGRSRCLCVSVASPVFKIKNPSQNVRKIGKVKQDKARVFSAKKFAIFLSANFSKYGANPAKTAKKMSSKCRNLMQFMNDFQPRQIINKSQTKMKATARPRRFSGPAVAARQRGPAMLVQGSHALSMSRLEAAKMATGFSENLDGSAGTLKDARELKRLTN